MTIFQEIYTPPWFHFYGSRNRQIWVGKWVQKWSFLARTENPNTSRRWRPSVKTEIPILAFSDLSGSKSDHFWVKSDHFSDFSRTLAVLEMSPRILAPSEPISLILTLLDIFSGNFTTFSVFSAFSGPESRCFQRGTEQCWQKGQKTTFLTPFAVLTGTVIVPEDPPTLGCDKSKMVRNEHFLTEKCSFSVKKW